MHSKSVFIYFSIMLCPIEIFKSTTAPSVDIHRFNRDSGVPINRPSSILFTSRIILLQKFNYVQMIPIPFGTTHVWLLRVLVILRYVFFCLFILIYLLLFLCVCVCGSISLKTKQPSAIMIIINNS